MSKIKSSVYLVALHSVEGIGSVRLRKMIDHFEDSQFAWEAKAPDLKALGFDERTSHNLDEKRKFLDPEKYFQEITDKGIKILTILDPEYPLLLKEIYDPPTVLYYRGDSKWLNKKSIGVVGTRKITHYGREITERLTENLSQAGVVIVSGLARGVDTVAHRSALKAGGKTLAVLGGGLNLIYPPENQRLAEEIADGNGAVITEFPPDYPHLAGNFPARNRIISGLSLGVLVTEAAEDSGSLITARSALEQGREVWAVPGPVTSVQSNGTAYLIKNGARLVTGVKDIIEDLGLELVRKIEDTKTVQISQEDQVIIDYLLLDNKHLDEICRDLNKSASTISAQLIKMEIQGLVRNLGGGYYTATKA